MRADIWVDFNDIDSDCRTSTLLKFAASPETLQTGKRLVAGDDDGNLCQSEVVGVEQGIVILALELDTFTSKSTPRLAVAK